MVLFGGELRRRGTERILAAAPEMATRPFSDHHQVTAGTPAEVLLQIKDPGVKSELSSGFILLSDDRQFFTQASDLLGNPPSYGETGERLFCVAEAPNYVLVFL